MLWTLRTKVLWEEHTPAIKLDPMPGKEDEHVVMLVGLIEKVAYCATEPRGGQLTCSILTHPSADSFDVFRIEAGAGQSCC
jgi:hypothetical protein